MRSDDDRIFKNLASAVVLRAVNDYREAILDGNTKMARDCERFFKSKWCSFLVRIENDDLAEKIKSETLAFKDLAFDAFDRKERENDTKTDFDAFECPTCAEPVEVKYDYYSTKSSTFGYTAICRSCGMTVRREERKNG